MSDPYTRAVLTVIAVALVWIAACLTTVPSARASSAGDQQVQRVDIVGVGGMRVDRTPGASTSSMSSIPVRETNSR
jgi:hypothetical protein